MGHSSGNDKIDVRVAVVGDQGTGKSRLIDAVFTGTFAEKVPPTLRTTLLPAELSPYKLPVTIVETSSSLENQSKLHQELELAHAVVLTYACDQPDSLDRIRDFWLPEFRRLEVKLPVVVAGCKLDAAEHEQINQDQEEVLSTILLQFPEVEFCTKCSAQKFAMVDDVFYLAQKAVIYPNAPLFDRVTQTLKPRCVSALKRIFLLCDQDGDEALNDTELNFFQVTCFRASLNPTDIESVKKAVKNNSSDGVNKRGVTLQGFLIIHKQLVTSGCLETWSALRKFGYDSDLKIRDDFVSVPTKEAPDQGVELTEKALMFLKGIFSLFDLDGDGVLHPAERDDLFSTAPECPWDEYPYKDAAEKTAGGGLSIDGFLAMWSLMTLLEPAKSLANLIYICYPDSPASALRLTRTRREERKKKQTERRVFHCFVFGPKGAGKSSLLNSFLKRPIPERYIPTIAERYAVNIDLVTKKTLVLHEIPEDGVEPLLSHKESLAACDIALFLHDSSDQESWKKTLAMLTDVEKHGAESRFEVPYLIAATKNDLDPFPEAKQDSESVCCNMGIEAPIPIQLGDLNDVFHKIVSVAERCQLNIPRFVAKRSRRQQRPFVNRTLMYVPVLAAVALVGVAAYRVYAQARVNTPS